MIERIRLIVHFRAFRTLRRFRDSRIGESNDGKTSMIGRNVLRLLVTLQLAAYSIAFSEAPPYLIDTTLTPRSISFENPTGAKGAGGQAASNLGVGRKGSPAKSLAPGEEVDLCDIEGTGIVRHIWMTTRNEPENLRGLVLRAYWDGQEHPSIECPLGDFMGFAHGKVREYHSAVHSVGKMAALNFWAPMPFESRARLTLTNERDAGSRLYYQVDYTLEETLPEDAGRLHVLFRRENPTTLKQDFEILPKREGKGRFLGCVLGVRYFDPSWWGEGEVKMYLDGDTEFPTICGTGTEDYIGLSWGLQETPHFYNGCSLNDRGYVSIYRWHLLDPIVWKNDARITIQQIGWSPKGYVERPDDWSVAAFWYEPVPSAPLPPLPSLEERLADLPEGNVLPTQIGTISPLEAAHLLEYELPDLDVTGIGVEEELGIPLYTVMGTIGEDRYEGYIDSDLARVLFIERNGEEIWRWKGIEVSAHRGAVKFAPENTLAAIDKAIELGADIVEMDIRETKDGVLVIHHDSTLGRTNDGSGSVSSKTLEELKRLDAGSWFDENFAGERIPTLKEALATLQGRARPDIDFKAGTPEKLIPLLHEFGFTEGVSLYCNNLEIRKEILDLDNKILARPKLYHGAWSLPALIEEWDPPIVNVEWADLTEDLVRDIHLAGKKAFVNVHSRHDTPYKIQVAIDSGADIVQADSLDILVSMLRDRGLHE
jgi:glycerophosphoryl diester phosphodiesterase